jgi:peptide-methionine (S)-S-oxide reductase
MKRPVSGVAVIMVLALASVALSISPKITRGENSGMTHSGRTEVATFGGGCFWCVEAVYESIPGVISVTSGYAGGKAADPSYEEVCTGATGHAEVTQILFDPGVIRFEDLLDVFWEAHDPTTLNRQGADVGTQYRSIILYNSEAQKAAAEKSKAALASSGKYRNPIVTEIVPLTTFYKAEEYHQNYYRNNPNAPYCALVISPKLKKLQLKKK